MAAIEEENNKETMKSMSQQNFDLMVIMVINTRREGGRGGGQCLLYLPGSARDRETQRAWPEKA